MLGKPSFLIAGNRLYRVKGIRLAELPNQDSAVHDLYSHAAAQVVHVGDCEVQPRILEDVVRRLAHEDSAI